MVKWEKDVRFGAAKTNEFKKAAEEDVVALYTNDVHTHIDNSVEEGGLTCSKAAALRDRLGNAILVDAGGRIP